MENIKNGKTESFVELQRAVQDSIVENGNLIMPGVYEVRTKMGTLFKISTLVFKADPYTLLKDQLPVKLRFQEGVILNALLEDSTFYVSRKVLIKKVWPTVNPEKVNCNGRLNVTVDRLKKALSVDPKIRVLCERGVGYKLYVDVSQEEQIE
ncbi:winged helix-turn-helix domain-containing protein [Parabacteroides pacaensis]|uniref:winged helix-turn-helix domain-containing protein n=1 Tax=Parabacteroides pacaensis TaxID=2086575 RepID=UPI000D0E3F87|nr:winged helix-turn-helix domain-containing protein [Parabacteroides pacaensis]